MKLFFAFLFLSTTAFAITLDWSGGYRIEYNEVDKPNMSEPNWKKSYGLQYLYLQPKIIGSDGINIISRFDILGSDLVEYRNSQLGSFIGSNLPATATDAQVVTQNSESSNLQVSQLYLNVNHEYGSLVAGRAPIEFGMGLTHNAGLGDFDHWRDTKDMVGYKFLVDNISLMPILSRIRQKDFGLGSTISEQIFVFEYDNKDIGAKAGVFHQTRKTSTDSNDGTATNLGYPGVLTKTGGFTSQTVNVFLERKWSSFEFRLEGSFLTGQTGLVNAGNEDVNINSYAVGTELLFPANDSSFQYEIKMGIVSGDNPTTTTYEGYVVDQNYDVGLLMFNHRLGSGVDYFGTSLLHPTGPNALGVDNSADDEAIGNATYLAPSFKYLMSEKMDLKTTLVYAQLLNTPSGLVDMKKDLGLELDMELIYKPRQRVTWSTGLGFLFPGAAWKAGTLNLDNDMSFGLTTKAAITF